MSKSVLPMFSSKTFIVSVLIFNSLIDFEFIFVYSVRRASQVVLVVKNQPDNAGDVKDASLILGSGRDPKKDMAVHGSILAWRIPGTVEPGELQSI